MATAFYICAVAGSGTDEDPYRPKVADATLDPSWPAGVPLNWVAVLKKGMGALVKVKVPDAYAGQCVQVADSLTNCWRTSTINRQHQLTEAEWNWLTDKATRLGIEDIPAYTAGVTLLQALRWLARHWEPAFLGDTNWDVIEP
jgi:hypothetical protein